MTEARGLPWLSPILDVTSFGEVGKGGWGTLSTTLCKRSWGSMLQNKKSNGDRSGHYINGPDGLCDKIKSLISLLVKSRKLEINGN